MLLELLNSDGINQALHGYQFPQLATNKPQDVIESKNTKFTQNANEKIAENETVISNSLDK